MPNFSQRSLENLETCHSDLQVLMHEVIKILDITVLEGHRSNQRQAELYSKGVTKAKPGRSKHNRLPSEAVDVAPYPIDWNDIDRFTAMGRTILHISEQLYRDRVIHRRVRWGGDWNMDGNSEDESFYDGPHFELI